MKEYVKIKTELYYTYHENRGQLLCIYKNNNIVIKILKQAIQKLN